MSLAAIQDRTVRERFVRSVASSFERAGVEYVFLHGYLPDSRDTDLDIAVDKNSLAVVDALVRTGEFGRLLQQFDYDIPWCRYYVVSAREPGRRYRQLDVACDPWGIGRYGPAIPLALRHAHRMGGLSVPEPAAEAVYLAVKRARKAAGPDAADLRRVFNIDPIGARRLLAAEFGASGAAVARAIASGDEMGSALAGLSRAVALRRGTPKAVARRSFYGPLRTVRRLRRPTGLVVGLVGPDGVGKTTLLADLEQSASGLFRRVVNLHLVPGVLPPPGRILRRHPSYSAQGPHSQSPSSHILSLARASYLVADTVLGWPTRVWLPRARSSLVVLERSLYDLSVDPKRYRVQLSPRLLRAIQRFVPRPDLILVLDAPAVVVHARKDELALPEVERQLRAWHAWMREDPERFRPLDSAKSRLAVLDECLGVVGGMLAARQQQLDLATTGLAALGGLAAEGTPYAIVSARGVPRWVIPSGSSPVPAGLYRPASVRHRLGAAAFRVAPWTSGRSASIDLARGLGPQIARVLGVDRVDLAACLPREPNRGHRALVSVHHLGKVVAIAKVSRNDVELRHEEAVLRALSRCDLALIVPPDVLGFIHLQELSALLLRAAATPGYSGREIGATELDALVELASLTNQMSSTLGRSSGLVPVHGDFTGWNSATLPDGRLALWDWEDARLGLPLEDFFYWRLRHSELLHSEAVDAIARDALAPGPPLLDLCTRLGIDSNAPARALMACLRREQGGPGVKPAALSPETYSLLEETAR